jgi:hypothetical protein
MITYLALKLTHHNIKLDAFIYPSNSFNGLGYLLAITLQTIDRLVDLSCTQLTQIHSLLDSIVKSRNDSRV